MIAMIPGLTDSRLRRAHGARTGYSDQVTGRRELIRQLDLPSTESRRTFSNPIRSASSERPRDSTSDVAVVVGARMLQESSLSGPHSGTGEERKLWRCSRGRRDLSRFTSRNCREISVGNIATDIDSTTLAILRHPHYKRSGIPPACTHAESIILMQHPIESLMVFVRDLLPAEPCVDTNRHIPSSGFCWPCTRHAACGGLFQENRAPAYARNIAHKL
jgi:hypothetical protein